MEVWDGFFLRALYYMMENFLKWFAWNQQLNIWLYDVWLGPDWLIFILSSELFYKKVNLS